MQAAWGSITPHSLAGGDFSQDWTNIGLITTDDDWSGVPSIVGYRGDGLTSATGTNPQTILAFAGPPMTPVAVVDVNANQTTPNTFTTGGVAEFQIANAVVALQGSGTADAPFLNFYMDATGRTGVTVSYSLRDIDGSTDDAAQQVAFQYRLSDSGNYTDVPTGYVSDATTGPSLATLVTPISISLAAWDNQTTLEFRIITTNAVGNDEWVGVDDISVKSSPQQVVPEFGTLFTVGGSLGLFGLGAMVRQKRTAA